MFNPMPDFQQSVELMKNMWTNATNTASANPTENGMPNFGIPGLSALNPFGIPTIDIEELDKRIKDLKSVETWLTLNLNILQTTIQGLEVQRATLAALQGIADTLKAGSTEKTGEADSAATPDTVADNFAKASEFVGASGKIAQDLMEQMSKSMTNFMDSIPKTQPVSKKAPARKTARKTASKPTAKTARSPRSR